MAITILAVGVSLYARGDATFETRASLQPKLELMEMRLLTLSLLWGSPLTSKIVWR